MALNLRKGLRDLMARRNKGLSSKEVPKSQDPANLSPPPPPPTTTLGLLPIPNLKKKGMDQEVEKGEKVPHKGPSNKRLPKTNRSPPWIVRRS